MEDPTRYQRVNILNLDKVIASVWEQLRGLTGAAICESRDLGTGWAEWHTLLFEERETSQDSFLEEMCSQARVRGVEGRSVAGAHPSDVKKENERVMDRLLGQHTHSARRHCLQSHPKHLNTAPCISSSTQRIAFRLLLLPFSHV